MNVSIAFLLTLAICASSWKGSILCWKFLSREFGSMGHLLGWLTAHLAVGTAYVAAALCPPAILSLSPTVGLVSMGVLGGLIIAAIAFCLYRERQGEKNPKAFLLELVTLGYAIGCVIALTMPFTWMASHSG